MMMMQMGCGDCIWIDRSIDRPIEAALLADSHRSHTFTFTGGRGSIKRASKVRIGRIQVIGGVRGATSDGGGQGGRAGDARVSARGGGCRL